MRALRFIVAITLLVACAVHPLVHAESSLLAPIATHHDCACLHGAVAVEGPGTLEAPHVSIAEIPAREAGHSPAAVHGRSLFGRAPPVVTLTAPAA